MSDPAKSYSLRRRLLLWLLVPLMCIGLVALYDGYRSARLTADEISDRVLAGSALAIAERVFVNEENTLEVDIPYVALEMLTSSEDDRVFYKIESDDGSFITGYRNIRVPEKFERKIRNAGFVNGVFRGAAIRLVVQSGAASSSTKSLGYRVIVAETTNARNAIARNILLRSALRQAILIAAAAIIVWFAVTRVLFPLHMLQSAVARRSADDVRPIEHVVPNEVSGLVRTINDLVKRFSASLDAMRNFTSNTSHQLRTPLALIRTHLEIAKRSDSQLERDMALSDANDAVSDAERLMAQMLLLARIDATSRAELSDAQTDLSALCREVCSEFVVRLKNTGKQGIDLGFEGDAGVIVDAEKTLLREVIRNLIDNSIVHGGTNARITVGVNKMDDQVKLTVQDNGPGIDEHVRKKIVRRFQRGASENSTGYGLGFAIIVEILSLFEGTIDISTPPESSGTSVEVTLQTAQKINA